MAAFSASVNRSDSCYASSLTASICSSDNPHARPNVTLWAVQYLHPFSIEVLSIRSAFVFASSTSVISARHSEIRKPNSG